MNLLKDAWLTVIIISLFIVALPHSVTGYETVHYNTTNQKEKVTISVPNVFAPETQKQWASIGRFLYTSPYKVIELRWQGFGGMVVIGEAFIKDMKRAQALGKKIIIHSSGDSYSMHALVVCYADEVQLDSSFLMFHADGVPINDTYYRVSKWYSTINNELDQCQRKGILKASWIDTLWKGYEIYVAKLTQWKQKDPRPKLVSNG